MLKPHIVILGAGFGGVYLAKKLISAVKNGEIDVTVISRNNNFLFTPLLHEVATGGLNPRTVAEPLWEIFVGTCVRIVEGTVDYVDVGDQNVSVKTGSGPITIKYDYLIVATGAETNYYGVPGAAEYSLSLKSLHDAVSIRNRVVDAFEQAIIVNDPEKRRGLLSFIVVGGGATGVEVAAELMEFIQGMMNRYYGDSYCRPDDPRHCMQEEPTVTLIHSDKELLSQFGPLLRISAEKQLKKKGIIVRLNSTVTSLTKNSLKLSSGEILPVSVVIWSAGVKASIPDFKGIKPVLTAGRISVDDYFRIVGNDRVFAIGDVAAYPRSLPQLAQVAESEARIVAMNLLSSIRGEPLHDFNYHSKGNMISIGQWFAMGEIYSVNISGRFAWWLWRTIYLFKFASWKKRIRISFEWLLQSFF
ncbi:MAG: NAD(P)/FAD-dependent oxidoreductase, partial [Candidatus Taylorbacteria bacterium]|nr:NAD(P)/FAD-dependent oxidoreductase [Candidatus Taylorbacteria bacterium]